MERQSNLKQFKKLFVTLFDMDIPIHVIAKSMGLSAGTVAKYYTKIKGKDSVIYERRTPAKTQWKMLAAYTSFLADPLMYKTTTAGTKHDLMRILEKELNLHELYVVIMTQLRFGQQLVQPVFGDGISEQVQKMITDAYFRTNDVRGYDKKPTMNHARNIAQQILIGLQTDKTPFPSVKQLADREVFYAKLTNHLPGKIMPFTAPIITKDLVEIMRRYFIETTYIRKQHKQAIEHKYRMGWVEIDNQWQKVTKQSTKDSLRLSAMTYLFSHVVGPLDEQPKITIQNHRDYIELWRKNNALQEELKQLQAEHANEISKLRFINAELKSKVVVSKDELRKIELEAEKDENGATSSGVPYKRLAMQIKDLDLSVRTFNCLKAGRLGYVWSVVLYPKKELIKFRNFGKKSLMELEGLLIEKGLLDIKLTPGEIELLKEITYRKDNAKIPWPFNSGE